MQRDISLVKTISAAMQVGFTEATLEARSGREATAIKQVRADTGLDQADSRGGGGK